MRYVGLFGSVLVGGIIGLLFDRLVLGMTIGLGVGIVAAALLAGRARQP